MTRWRVDLPIRTFLGLHPDQDCLAYSTPDGSTEIWLRERSARGRLADCPLTAHVILEEEDRIEALKRARELLRPILTGLNVVTGVQFELGAGAFVIDWSPGLAQRRVLVLEESQHPVVLPLLRQRDLDVAGNVAGAGGAERSDWWTQAGIRHFRPQKLEVGFEKLMDASHADPDRPRLEEFDPEPEALVEHPDVSRDAESLSRIMPQPPGMPAKSPLWRYVAPGSGDAGG